MKKLILILLAVAFLSINAYADITGYNNGTQVGRAEEINFANGLQATRSGEKITVGFFGSAVGYVSQPSATAALPTAYSVVGIPLTNAAGAVYTLANGTPGQEVTFVAFGKIASDTAVITPATSTAFTTATLANNGASVTLEYVNSTVGWVVNSYDNNTVS